MAHTHKSSIYGVVEREFRQEGPTVIVKLGRVGTRPVHKRLAEYPNGSVCLFAFSVQTGMDVVVEAAVLAAARKMFKERRDIGAEYIEAPAGELMALVGKIVAPFLAIARTSEDVSVDADEEDTDQPEADEVKNADEEACGENADQQAEEEEGEQVQEDLPMLVYRFIEERIGELSAATVPVASMYDEVNRYTGAKKAMASGRLTNILVKYWKVKSTIADMGNGQRPVYVFPNLEPSNSAFRLDMAPVDMYMTAVPNTIKGYGLKYARHTPGSVTEWMVFKRAFEEYGRCMRGNKKWKVSTEDRGMLEMHGYRVYHENVCTVCGGFAHVRCCPGYFKMNRTRKWMIHDMEMYQGV